MNYIPISITKPAVGYLKAIWDDGFESIIKLEKLKKECPCADCREKQEVAQQEGKFSMPIFKQGQFELKSLTPIGNYAINAEWADGHTSGIYPWEYFRSIFEKYKVNQEEILKIIKNEN